MYVSHYSVTLQLAALVAGMPTRSPHGHPLLLESALIRHFHHLFPHPHLHLVLVAQHLVLPLNELLLQMHTTRQVLVVSIGSSVVPGISRNPRRATPRAARRRGRPPRWTLLSSRHWRDAEGIPRPYSCSPSSWWSPTTVPQARGSAAV